MKTDLLVVFNDGNPDGYPGANSSSKVIGAVRPKGLRSPLKKIPSLVFLNIRLLHRVAGKTPPQMNPFFWVIKNLHRVAEKTPPQMNPFFWAIKNLHRVAEKTPPRTIVSYPGSIHNIERLNPLRKTVTTQDGKNKNPQIKKYYLKLVPTSYKKKPLLNLLPLTLMTKNPKEHTIKPLKYQFKNPKKINKCSTSNTYLTNSENILIIKSVNPQYITITIFFKALANHTYLLRNKMNTSPNPTSNTDVMSIDTTRPFADTTDNNEHGEYENGSRPNKKQRTSLPYTPTSPQIFTGNQNPDTQNDSQPLQTETQHEDYVDL